MAAECDNNFMRYVYRGEEGEIIPRGATHIIVHESVTVIRARAFYEHPNITEVICHYKVEKIEERAFYWCDCLRRVIMPGVKIVESWAFDGSALADVECGMLEIIQEFAFSHCKYLKSINLPSARIVKSSAFGDCFALTVAKFGSKLERIEGEAFWTCNSLERITIPLKDGIFLDADDDEVSHDEVFRECAKLNQVDLVEGELHETIAALQSDDWKDDMYEEIYSINQILLTVDGGHDDYYYYSVGEKSLALRSWIRSILSKIIEYKAKHRHSLDENVVPALQCVLPQDIVMNSVLPFLELPSHVFEVGNHNDAHSDNVDMEEE